MASLHKVTEETKTIFKWGVILIVLAFVSVALFRLGVKIKEHYYPTPPTPPTVLFGKLSPIVFPQNATQKKLTFLLDTISGTFPVFPDRVNVYTFQKNQPNFLNLKRTKEKAIKLGFLNQETAITNTNYVWAEINPPFRKLFFDIISFNFSITSPFLADPSIIESLKGRIDSASAETSATNVLTNIGLFPNDIDITKTQTTLLSIEDEQLIPATSISKATLARVDFFQKDIDLLSFFYPHPPQSTMSFLFVGGRFNETLIEASFNHFYLDQTRSSSTYPIKTAEEAFKELQTGKAYIASYFGDATNIRITDVILGYYMSDNPQDYLMPIFVFRGDNGFFAYVSAIKDAWIQTPLVQI